MNTALKFCLVSSKDVTTKKIPEIVALTQKIKENEQEEHIEKLVLID